MVRLPFTRLVYRAGFRPDRYRLRASLSPRATFRLLQYDDARALTTSRIVFLVLRGEVTNLPPPSPSCRPLAGTIRADEPRRCMLPKKRVCGTGLIQVKVHAAFRQVRPLLEPAPRTSFVV
jgi:hypothetical protein